MSPTAAFRFAAIGLTFAAAGCAQRSAVPFEQGSSRYTFAIGIVEAAGPSGTFSCTARVADLVSKASIEAPAVEAKKGAPGRVTQEDAGSGATLEVDLVVDGAANEAVCTAAVKKGGLLIATDSVKRAIR